jgi:hypothetical protein
MGIVKAYDDWAAKNRKNLESKICTFLEEGEELQHWVVAKTAPNELYSWLPIFSIYYKLNTKHYALAITTQRVVRFRVTKLDGSDPHDPLSTPLEQIKRIDVKSGPLFSDIFIQSGASTQQYKDIEKEEAQAFVKAHKALKPAPAKSRR